MILRKPYAFFIKIFKPIHVFMAFLIAFLIYKTNDILSFFNSYIYSNDNVLGEVIKEKLVSNILFVIPIALIIFSLIFLGIMFSKSKPVVFYITTIFLFLIVLIINLYSSNFLGVMEEAIVSIKMVKLYHDLVLINMIIEIIVFITLIIRGLGINFKKFNFDSDITKLNINDSDKEEFEFNISIDIDNVKRKRKKQLRNIKYIYKENKIVINIFAIFIFIIGALAATWIVLYKEKINVEGIAYSMSNFNLMVNKTLILKENFSGEILTENNLVVIDLALRSNFSGVALFTKDFSLEIGETVFYVESKYNNELLDLGNAYKNNILSKDYENYLLIFEISDKYLESEMYLVFNNEGIKNKIKLTPQRYISNKIVNVKNIGDKLSFEESLGEIFFSINSFDIKNEFLINYKYCVEDECIISKEYIEPSINENFDKNVLKLSVDFVDNSKLDIKSFYNFFSRFGSIHYKKGDTWISQKTNFEELKSKKVANENNVYIGINSDVSGAESLKLVFNIRSCTYEYVLK